MTTSPESLDTHRLTEEQIRFWEENGYFIFGSLFDEDELAEGREHLARCSPGNMRPMFRPIKLTGGRAIQRRT